ncbi:hypothetical protein NM208_g4839 [Fusarium decemcellulare]|uniref:Uncharacterized protein n=1 Tax=Fusarium decemcellulare TaxID=57161 RepID=A0ACC1SJA0_9HYPO|nr:hypothetical protein NM208_g4839 [Fusarium decemcellulare]
MDTRRQFSWRATFTFISFLLVSFILLPNAGSSHKPRLNPRVFTTDGDFHDNAIGNLTKRANDDYNKAHDKGHTLHCRMGMSQEAAQAANKGDSLESKPFLQINGLEDYEGWQAAEASAGLFGDRLNEALGALGVPIDLRHEHWHHNVGVTIYSDPISLIDQNVQRKLGTAKDGQATGAYFQNSFVRNPGVIIADNNYGIGAALKDADEDPKAPATNIRQWSDAAWMQFYKVTGGAVDTLKYIIRAQISNETTLKVIFQAILNKHARDEKGTRIGTWRDRITLTLESDSNELFGVLGSPNGSGAAFLLINHKERLGVRTINEVDIFLPEGSYEVAEEDGEDITTAHEDLKIMLLLHVTDA